MNDSTCSCVTDTDVKLLIKLVVEAKKLDTIDKLVLIRLCDDICSICDESECSYKDKVRGCNVHFHFYSGLYLAEEIDMELPQFLYHFFKLIRLDYIKLWEPPMPWSDKKGQFCFDILGEVNSEKLGYLRTPFLRES